jgi:hypothetical protein
MTLLRNQKISIFTAKSDTKVNSSFKFDKIVKLKNPNRQMRSLIIDTIKKLNNN